ncbi:hypothetical protein Leryth_027338 [Lithospermum erythrorhizon]|nr:hypothetical protein Leryth_027338 [Lithospermum erythrorhizon]
MLLFFSLIMSFFFVKWGIIIGPSVLGHTKNFKEYMFPDNMRFVLKNLAVIGFMYFLFLSGVKIDLRVLFKANKKQWCISIIGVAAPLLTSTIVAISMRKYMRDGELGTFSSIYGIAASIAVTSFPVLYPVLQELNLLSSDIGRLALKLAVIGDVVGIHGVSIFEAAKQAEGKESAALWYTISLFVIGVTIIGGVRQAMRWIVQSTPEGQPVEQIYVISILLGVFVSGFITDMCGVAICNGPLWLGLAVPDGPPLGATIVEKCETIVLELLMPISFAYIGMVTDIPSISGQWYVLQPLFYMALIGYLTKIFAILLVGRLFKMTFRDSLALALIMSIRGQLELILFVHWMDFKMIGEPQFTMFVLLTLLVTAIVTPMINLVYDPTKPYMIDKRRNIQHTAINAELQIVACIYDDKNVGGMTKLLEVSNPTVDSPLSVHALHLVELVGSATGIFTGHDDEESSNSSIHNALKLFHEGRDDVIKMHYYTSVSPRRSMYQDICEVALSKKASLIILPYEKDNPTGTDVVGRESVQSVNFDVLNHAPCSVALLIVNSSCVNIYQENLSHSEYRFVVLFLGGADAREALAYADKMATNPDVSITVVRFLSDNNQGDDMMEKKLDDGMVTWFWVKNEGNERVAYREVVVKNGDETVGAIQAMNNDHCDLWIVGRKQGINPRLLYGLSNWSHNRELGAVGDYVASPDLGSSGSVLVVQQQILRGQHLAGKKFFNRLRFCKPCHKLPF